MKWTPVATAALVLVILAYGLSLVARENIKVAPWAETATEGRLHYQMKNTTRFAGDPEQVRRAVWRAVYLEDAPPAYASPSQGGWMEEIRAQLRIGQPIRHVVVLPAEGESAPAWALPGAYWAAYSGSPAVFVGIDQLGPEAGDVLRRHKVPIFVLAPESAISDRVFQQIMEIGPVQRIAGDNPAEHAVRIAEFRDRNSGFGWGRTYEQRDGYFEYVVAAPSEARQALAALPLARSNAAALLYAGDDGGVPAELDRYAWRQRADWFVTPSEGPFRHFWIVGDRVSYAAQSRLDHALEKGPYPSRGPTAFGPTEALLTVFIALGWACAVFVFLHGLRLLPEVSPGMRIAWTMTALLTPLLGVILYLAAYRHPKLNPGEKHPQFLRAGAITAAAATAMGFGYGAPLMIVIGYAFVWFGFPLFFGPWADGVEFLFGAGMVLMMVAMWAGAILTAWLLVQLPMWRMMMPGMPVGRAALRTLAVTTVSMSAVSLGMMTMAWWMQMFKLPMMPGEDEILWFGAMWLASFIGFLIAWPLNYPLVRTGFKMGGM